MNEKKLKDKILETVYHADRKIVFYDLIRSVAEQLGVRTKDVKKVASSLVTSRDLMFTYKLGCSFVEPAINRPVKITPELTLVPHHFMVGKTGNEQTVVLVHGASFGIGDHPTTRLVIKGLVELLRCSRKFKPQNRQNLLDIGTGSGILAIVAVRLGVSGALGIDRDPCSLFEASQNVKLNGLDEKIEIKDLAIEKIKTPFNIITGNLRYPTLKKLFPHFKRLLVSSGSLIISGFKLEEAYSLIGLYTSKGFRLEWEMRKGAWVGLAFKRD